MAFILFCALAVYLSAGTGKNAPFFISFCFNPNSVVYCYKR